MLQRWLTRTYTGRWFLCFSLNLFLASYGTAAITWQSDVSGAAKEAARTGKPMLIKIGTSWCHYCVKMDRETFADAAIGEQIGKCFIPLKLDGDSNRNLVRQLGVNSFPTMVIVSPKMNVLAKIRGFRNVDQLTADLKSVCSHQGAGKQRGPSVSRHRPSPFGSFCPVGSLNSQRLVSGSREHESSYRGFQLQFSSSEARKQFQADPSKFWPVGDGHCVVSYFDHGKAKLGSVYHSLIHADRIWLFASQEHLERFARQPARYIDKVVNENSRSAATSRQPRSL